MNTEYDITQVEKYFDNELSDPDVREFQDRVRTDQSFKTLVEQERAIIQGIRLEGLSRDLRYLESVEKTIGAHQKTDSIRLGKVWYYAAAAIILLIATVGLFVYSPKQSSEELFIAYFDKPYPNIFEATKRGSDNAQTARSEAFQAYEQRDYAKAAALFEDLLKNKKEPEILMLLGNSNLMLGKVEEAKQNFLTLLNDFDELDLPAKWYLSLCYLKSGDVDNARIMLKELGGTEVSYAAKAKELLNKVD